MLKVAGSKPAAPAPTNDAPPAEAGLGEEPAQDSSDDKPFDAEPFNAGVEADEDSDPKKFIEQLTGKLGQSLRKYNEAQGQPDFELEKFAINSLLSASHTSEMDSNDQDDIIKKVKTAGNDDKEENNDDNNDDSADNNAGSSDGDSVSSDFGGGDSGSPADSGNGGGDGVNEETDLFLANPKKNNMFQPGSNDILDKNLNISEKISTIAKIREKLKETFNQDDMTEPMTEPMVKPTVKPSPDKVKPSIAPSRKNKPFLPMPEVQPDPKASK